MKTKHIASLTKGVDELVLSIDYELMEAINKTVTGYWKTKGHSEPKSLNTVATLSSYIGKWNAQMVPDAKSAVTLGGYIASIMGMEVAAYFAPPEDGEKLH